MSAFAVIRMEIMVRLVKQIVMLVQVIYLKNVAQLGETVFTK